MSDLRVPSVQHLSRNWRDSPATIARLLVQLAKDPPRFNYNPLYGAVRDLLILKVPYGQVEEGIRRIKRKSVRENLLEVLPLIRDHFDAVAPDFFQTVDRRYYQVGRGLMVPFDPPMIYGVGGQLYFPWFSFWRSNPLSSERLSLFVTFIDEILMQDPDLEMAKFSILDFSCPGPRTPRQLQIKDASEIPRLSEARKVEMLKIFAEGYFQASRQLEAEYSAEAESSEKRETNPDQPSLF